MGHIFLLCGPPGAGKTTLLKEINRRKVQLKQLRRITTRKSRREEGDQGKQNLEYEFLLPVEFAERLSKGNIYSFIEWNGNYYATQTTVLEEAIKLNENSVLLEDIPSALALKERYKSDITVVLIYTADKQEIVHSIDFASYQETANEHIVEWKRRIGLKYDESVKIDSKLPIENDRIAYIDKKMGRAIHDLAFIIGKIRESAEILVLANRKDKIKEMVNEFLNIVNDKHVEKNTAIVSKNSKGHIKSVSDPSKLTIREIIQNMTVPQLWKTFAAIIGIITIVAVGAYKIGAGEWLLKQSKANQQIQVTPKSSAPD